MVEVMRSEGGGDGGGDEVMEEVMRSEGGGDGGGDERGWW